jgi:hypothetical protein
MYNLYSKKSNLVIFMLLILSVLGAIYFRLVGLGKFPLAVDEYYTLQSVENILKYGLPKFHLAGYYDRGILFQYFVAPLLLAGLKPEFAGRIVPVICNIIMLIPFYLLTKKISGKLLALVLIFILCFSVWEIEIARFARMYTPFQMIFVFYIYFLYRCMIEGDIKSNKWLFILSFISIFVYEASIFLCLLNFLPLIWDTEKKSFTIEKVISLNFSKYYLAISTLILIFGYLFLKFNFRHIGVNEAQLFPANLPQINDTDAHSEGSFRLPKILALTIFHDKVFMGLFVVFAAVLVYSIYKILKSRVTSIAAKVCMILLIILFALNLFGLSLVLLVLFYFMKLIEKKDLIYSKNEDPRSKILGYKAHVIYLLIFPALFSFVFWSAFALHRSAWHQFFPGEHLTGTVQSLKVLWKEFINYPFFYETFVLFRDTIPRYTFIIIGLLGGGILLLLFKKDKEDYKYRFLYIIFIILILLVNILNLTYFETRYFFFLFPLVIILAYSTILRVTEFFVHSESLKLYTFAVPVILILLISEDFNPKYLINIDTSKINYRVNESFELKSHYYPRWDTRTPAEIINNKLEQGDIVISNQQVNGFYLKRIDYMYVDYRSERFGSISLDYGRKEIWTDANLIYDDKSLINLLNEAPNRKWLIINTAWDISYLKKDNFFQDFKKYAVYANKDSSAILYKIPPKPGFGMSN